MTIFNRKKRLVPTAEEAPKSPPPPTPEFFCEVGWMSGYWNVWLYVKDKKSYKDQRLFSDWATDNGYGRQDFPSDCITYLRSADEGKRRACDLIKGAETWAASNPPKNQDRYIITPADCEC